MNFSFRSKAAESSGYRADIDGLRAIAVLSVVLYHAGLPGFPGGFVGVDIFLVISGYLITRVLEGDLAKGRFSFASFYERRIRRIFPALFLVALVCTGLALFLFPPQQFHGFAKSLLAMTCFVSNIYFKRTSHAAGYFADTSGVQLLLHTWSLSVEEQFYLFFPILLLVLHRWARAYKRAAFLLFILISFLISISEVKHSSISAFYLLYGRAWELLVGAVLAVKRVPQLKSYAARSLLGLAGILAIAYAVASFSGATPFPGRNALFPCLGAALIIYSGEGEGSAIQRLLSVRPFVFIGVISYSLYLWHWPFLALTRYYYAAPWVTPKQEIVPLALSFLFAFLSFEFIETPFRRRKIKSDGGRRAVWLGVGATACLAGLAYALINLPNIPTGLNSRTNQLASENFLIKDEYSAFPEPCNNFGHPFSHYADEVFCDIQQGPRNILFWGDSHVAQLYPALSQMKAEGHLAGHGIVFADSSGCPPTETINRSDPGFFCDNLARFAIERASKPDIDTVFILFSPWWEIQDGVLCTVEDGHCGKILTGKEAGHRVAEQVAANIAAVRATGRRVILGLPFPFYDKMIPDYEIRVATIGSLGRFGGTPLEVSPIGFREELKQRAIQAGAEIYDPRDALCPNGVCTYQSEGLSLYKDNNHLAVSRVGIISDTLRRILESPAQDHGTARAL